MRLKEINFWKRLEMFVGNVQVSDMPSEEEKDMILNICRREQIEYKENILGDKEYCPDCKIYVSRCK